MNKLGIYVHVPFCVQKCRYCDFYSLPESDLSRYSTYKDALKRHFEYMSVKASEYIVDSIYFGGGTPSLLPSDVLSELLASIRSHYRVSDDCEMTLEMNPGTADYEAMKVYIKSGFNRLSIGCQSANDSELRMLGRIHSFSDFCKTVEDARCAGFENISADLMMALPKQNLESLTRSIDQIAKTKPNHISVYGLKIEKGTWFDLHKDELSLPNEDTECELYLETVSQLEQRGYYQYEISNFSQKGYESRHNLKYWRSMPYIGFGPAAYSFIDNMRYGYKRDLSGYLQACQTSDYSKLIHDEEFLTLKDCIEEKLLLGLRLREGICIDEFPFDESVDDYIKMLCAKEMAELEGGRLRLTPKGMLINNLIISELLIHLQTDE